MVYLQERKSLLQKAVPWLMATVGRFFSDKAVVHICDSAEQVAAKLARHGLTRESLPFCMGGLVDTTGGTASVPLAASPGVVNTFLYFACTSDTLGISLFCLVLVGAFPSR